MSTINLVLGRTNHGSRRVVSNTAANNEYAASEDRDGPQIVRSTQMTFRASAHEKEVIHFLS
jgi:hypothetical protein